MTPTAHRDLQTALSRKLDRVDNVTLATAAGDQCRPLIDQAIVDLPGVIVARVGRLQEVAGESLGQIRDRVGECLCNSLLPYSVFGFS